MCISSLLLEHIFVADVFICYVHVNYECMHEKNVWHYMTSGLRYANACVCEGISEFCMTILSGKRRILHCCNRGQRCPVRLWETESRWSGCNRHSDALLTESKGRDPELALCVSEEKLQVLSTAQRGVREPEDGGD